MTTPKPTSAVAVVAGASTVVTADAKCTTSFSIPAVESFGLDLQATKAPGGPLPSMVRCILKMLDHSGSLPVPERRSLILEASTAVVPALSTYANLVNAGTKRIRPRHSIAIESSFPTAEAAIQAEITGPTATLAQPQGGLHAVALATDVLRAGWADVVIAGEILREVATDDAEQFCGKVTSIALMRMSCAPTTTFGYLRAWAWNRPPYFAVPVSSLDDFLRSIVAQPRTKHQVRVTSTNDSASLWFSCTGTAEEAT